MCYGYARVSTKDQCVDRQFKALEDSGIRKSCIYVDKVSGKDFNRRNYLRLFRRLRSGDELFVNLIGF